MCLVLVGMVAGVCVCVCVSVSVLVYMCRSMRCVYIERVMKKFIEEHVLGSMVLVHNMYVYMYTKESCHA